MDAQGNTPTTEALPVSSSPKVLITPAARHTRSARQHPRLALSSSRRISSSPDPSCITTADLGPLPELLADSQTSTTSSNALSSDSSPVSLHVSSTTQSSSSLPSTPSSTSKPLNKQSHQHSKTPSKIRSHSSGPVGKKLRTPRIAAHSSTTASSAQSLGPSSKSSTRTKQRHLAEKSTSKTPPLLGNSTTLSLGRGPIAALTTSPDGQSLFAINSAKNSITVLKTEQLTLLDTLVGNADIVALAAALPGCRYHTSQFYLATSTITSDSIITFDQGAIRPVNACPISFTVRDLVVDPCSSQLYLTRITPTGPDLVKLDPHTGTYESLSLSTAYEATPLSLRVSADGQYLYCALYQPHGDSIVIVDQSMTLLAQVSIPGMIRDIALSPTGNRLFIVSETERQTSAIHVIDLHTGQKTHHCTLSTRVTQLIMSRDGDRLYCLSETSIIVISPHNATRLETKKLSRSPSCAIESVDGSTLYLADYTSVVRAFPLALVAPMDNLSDQMIFNDAVHRMLDLQPTG